MKILHVSTNDMIGGAGIFSKRLVQEQINQDINSILLVRNNLSKLNFTKKSETSLFKRKINKKLKYYFSKIYLKDSFSHFSTGIFSEITKNNLIAFKPDIIHLHWFMNSFLSLNQLKYIKIPIIMTLHDSWALTGGCHLPFVCEKFYVKCRRCPLFKTFTPIDICEYLWMKKKRAFEIIPLHIVCPSKWIYSLTEKSSITKRSKLYQIQNGINMNIFSPRSKNKLKNLFGLNPDKLIVALGAFNLYKDNNKSFDLAIEILSSFFKTNPVNKYQIVFFGDKRILPKISSLNYECKIFDTIYDENTISNLYNSIDLFIVPSRLENLSNSIAESLSCGTPVVSFNVGGNRDLISHNQNGYLAVPYDIDDFKNGMMSTLTRFANLERSQLIDNKFDIKIATQKYISLYKDILQLKTISTQINS